MPKPRFPDGPILRRARATRAPKLRIYIFAEGKNTEPGYFKEFAAEHGNSLVEVRCEGGAGVPATLVKKAKTLLRTIRRSSNSFERRDQVWVVFDEDEHPNVKQAVNAARALGIAVAYSNPCFELWLLLHHREHDAPDDRHRVQRKLAQVDKGYDPKSSKVPTYSQLSANYEQAKSRAKKMRKRRKAEGNARGCPFTDVDRLTELIIANGKRSR